MTTELGQRPPDGPGRIQPEFLAWLEMNNMTSSAADEVARALCVVPSSDGGLQIEWHCNGQDVEVYVSPKGLFEGVSVA